MKGSKVALIHVDTTNAVITGDKISNITSYHSIQFHTDHMIMWCYFGIEIGINRNAFPIWISKHLLKFLNVSVIQKASKRKKSIFFFKEQEDRTLNTILFYSTAEWAEKTDETSKLEEHVLSEKLSVPEETSFDQVLYWENEAKVTATPPLKFVNKY